MSLLIENIINKNYDASNRLLEEMISIIMEKKLHEIKKRVAAKMCDEGMDTLPSVEKLKRGLTEDEIDEEDEHQLDEAPRVKIVKARVRGGKIQRRKKVANVQGYTMRGGKLTRMSPAERRKRKLGQRRGKLKRRAKLNKALMKRQRSLRKRKTLGL